MTKHSLLLIVMSSVLLRLQAQINVFEPMSPDIQLLGQRTYPEDAGKKYNDATYHSHPDFGKLTFDAPYNKNVVEVISKRTADSRYYIDLNDPTFFYILQAAKPLNIWQNGMWRAIDPTLHAVSGQVYQSGIQANPTKLDLENKTTSIQLANSEFKFNHYSLKVIYNDNSSAILSSDWSNIALGNEGAYVTDVFPGIDLKLVFSEGGIESDFIIRENLHVKKLVLMDELTIPSYLNGYVYTNETVANGPLIFENIYNGEAVLKFDRARCHDASGNKHSWINPYTLNGNVLEILCDSAQLNNPEMMYPITIDPLVTVVGPIASGANLQGSRLSPLSCSNTINVTFPGGTTPWDVSAFWNIYTDFCADDLLDYGVYFDCYRSEAQVWITSSCGGISPVGAPGTIWTCLGCNSYGTWNPTLPFANSGTQSLAQCYTPSCSNQIMPFTINNNRAYCTSFYGYDLCAYANSYCSSLRNWSVTVQGRNAETLGNTATGNGSATIAAPTCASGTTLLNPTPLYGVPGYTYLWNTTETTSTITVPNGSATYTCQVTDACGTVRVATITITCPLALNLVSFDAESSDAGVELKWTTASEKDNDYFSIRRAGSDLQFEEIGRVESQGDATNQQFYSFTDENPLKGVNYYQLGMVDLNGQSTLSDIRTVGNNGSAQPLVVSPNPNNGNFTVELNVPEGGDYTVEVTSTEGKLISQQTYSFTIGQHVVPFNKLQLQKGTYVVRIRNGKLNWSEKIVVE